MGIDGFKIVSGGQTGADRAALDWAIEKGVPHGGWCPQGRKAEDGVIDAKNLLKETPNACYVERTEWNVRDSEATAIFSIRSVLSGGSQKTLHFARKQKKPCLVLSQAASESNAADLLERFVNGSQVKVLHVAGPRSSEEPDVGAFVRSVLDAWRRRMLAKTPAADPITTPRLALRALSAADASDLALLAGRKEIADTTISIPHPYSEGQAREWIGSVNAAAAEGKELAFGINLRSRLIGVIGLRDIDREHS